MTAVGGTGDGGLDVVLKVAYFACFCSSREDTAVETTVDEDWWKEDRELEEIESPYHCSVQCLRQPTCEAFMYNVEEEKTCSLGSIQVGSGGDGDGSRSVGVRVLKGRTSDLLANAGPCGQPPKVANSHVEAYVVGSDGGGRKRKEGRPPANTNFNVGDTVYSSCDENYVLRDGGGKAFHYSCEQGDEWRPYGNGGKDPKCVDDPRARSRNYFVVQTTGGINNIDLDTGDLRPSRSVPKPPDMFYPKGAAFMDGLLLCETSEEEAGEAGSAPCFYWTTPWKAWMEVDGPSHVHIHEFPALTAHDQRFWMIAGRTKSEVAGSVWLATNVVEYFDGSKWSRASDYPKYAMGSGAAAISDGRLMSCGGFASEGYLELFALENKFFNNNCFTLDTSDPTGPWIQAADLPRRCYLPELAVTRGKRGREVIVAIGGLGINNERINMVAMYHVAANEWEVRDDMYLGTYRHTILPTPDKRSLYVLGSVEVEVMFWNPISESNWLLAKYDVEKDSWERRPDLDLRFDKTKIDLIEMDLTKTT